MAKLINRRKGVRLALLFAAALGCSSAALSGTLAAFTYAVERESKAPATVAGDDSSHGETDVRSL